jgi:hypothetical protein
MVSSTTAIMLLNLCSLYLGDRSIARRIAKSVTPRPTPNFVRNTQ